MFHMSLKMTQRYQNPYFLEWELMILDRQIFFQQKSPIPIITIFVICLGSCPHSLRESFAIIIWDTISWEVKFLTNLCVPVWQKVQLRVQPTWLETHNVPLSSSGIKTVSTSEPSLNFNNHFFVPSFDICSSEIWGLSRLWYFYENVVIWDKKSFETWWMFMGYRKLS